MTRLPAKLAATLGLALLLCGHPVPAQNRLPAPGTQLNQAEALYEQEEYASALVVYRRVFNRARAAKDQPQLTAANKRISDCLYAIGDYEPALTSYRQTLALQQQLNDQAGIADTWLRLGNAHFALGDLDAAFDHYQQSLQLARQRRDSLLTAEALSTIGLVHYTRGDLQLALDSYYQSLNLYTAAEELGPTIRLLQSVGNASFRLGNYRIAMEGFQNARFLLERAGKIDDAKQLLLAIGLVHFAQKSYPLATEVYQHARDYFEHNGDRASLALALHRLGLVNFAEGNFREALALQERAAALAAPAESLDTLWRAQLESGRAWLQLQQPVSAQQAWLQSIATIEKMRSSLRGNETEAALERMAPYLGLVELFTQQNQALAAFNFAERAKAQLLWGILQSARQPITKSLTLAEIAAETNARKAVRQLSAGLDRARRKKAPEAVIASLTLQVRSARAALTALTRRLYIRHPRLKIYRGEAPAITAEEAAGFLTGPQHALVEFVLTDQQVLLFVLTSASGGTAAQADLNTYVLEISPPDLTARVAKLREQIVGRDENYAAAARALYDVLLKPAAGQLAGKKMLTIIPDGVLWELPFAALQPAENRFLIEEYTLTAAVSTSAWREAARLARPRQPSSALSVAVLAPPAPDAAWLAPFKLAPAVQPAQWGTVLREIYGPRHTRVSERLTAFVPASLLHIAAPVYLNNVRPFYSFLAATGREIVPLWQFAQFQLRADLILAGEAVARPEFRRSGNGLIGLNWAALLAGSPAVLTSQWQTDPSALLTKFHQQYKVRVAAPFAWQQACVQLIATPDFRHPANWAGFVLFDGNWIARGREPQRTAVPHH